MLACGSPWIPADGATARAVKSALHSECVRLPLLREVIADTGIKEVDEPSSRQLEIAPNGLFARRDIFGLEQLGFSTLRRDTGKVSSST